MSKVIENMLYKGPLNLSPPLKNGFYTRFERQFSIFLLTVPGKIVNSF